MEVIARQRQQPVPVTAVLASVLPHKVPSMILRLAGVAEDSLMGSLAEDRLAAVLDVCRHLTIEVKGTRGFGQAQLSTGGVPVTEVEPTTMASRQVAGVHLAGEVLDVVGPCGGYNLQFAWTSGALAGRGAATS
jgi:predicted flavoprotein YhiN